MGKPWTYKRMSRVWAVLCGSLTIGWWSGCSTLTLDYTERPYNEYVQVCTHNAMSNEADNFIIPPPNQKYSLTRQLDDGVRCMMLDTHYYEDEAYLCHGYCGIWGARPLVDGLVEIREWMEENPTEVVTLIIESHLIEARTREAFVSAGLVAGIDGSELVYTPTEEPGAKWPTIGEMVERRERLVVFTNDWYAQEPWHLYLRTYGWETEFDDLTFSCDHYRGASSDLEHRTFLLNHYALCEWGACEEYGLIHNAYDFLYDRAEECWLDNEGNNPGKKPPTFINVDQYHVPAAGESILRPDVFEVADALNEAYGLLALESTE